MRGLAVSCWRLAVSCWLLTIGCWLLGDGCRTLAQKRSKFEFRRNLPVYADSLLKDLTYPMAWGNSPITNFDAWRQAARQKVFDCMLTPPPPPLKRGERKEERGERKEERGYYWGRGGYAHTGVILSYMQWSDVAQWADTKVGRRGQDYKDFKERKAQRLIASLERHFPGVSSKIKRYYTSTPLTYRDYTGTEHGGMYGCAKDIAMGAACRVPHRTKIPNLLQTGQNINSHGMQGVIVGTIVTCSELLTAEKIYRQIMET